MSKSFSLLVFLAVGGYFVSTPQSCTVSEKVEMVEIHHNYKDKVLDLHINSKLGNETDRNDIVAKKLHTDESKVLEKTSAISLTSVVKDEPKVIENLNKFYFASNIIFTQLEDDLIDPYLVDDKLPPSEEYINPALNVEHELELPPSEEYIDPDPSEIEASLSQLENSDSSYAEPLIDPSTGLTEDQLLQIGDESAATTYAVDPSDDLN